MFSYNSLLYDSPGSHQKYKLGDPTKPDTNLGPVVSLASADRIRKQVTDAGIFVHFIARRVVET